MKETEQAKETSMFLLSCLCFILVLFFGCSKSMSWLFYTIIQGTYEDTQVQSGMELHTEAESDNEHIL